MPVRVRVRGAVVNISINVAFAPLESPPPEPVLGRHAELVPSAPP